MTEAKLFSSMPLALSLLYGFESDILVFTV